MLVHEFTESAGIGIWLDSWQCLSVFAQNIRFGEPFQLFSKVPLLQIVDDSHMEYALVIYKAVSFRHQLTYVTHQKLIAIVSNSLPLTLSSSQLFLRLFFSLGGHQGKALFFSIDWKSFSLRHFFVMILLASCFNCEQHWVVHETLTPQKFNIFRDSSLQQTSVYLCLLKQALVRPSCHEKVDIFQSRRRLGLALHFAVDPTPFQIKDVLQFVFRSQLESILHQHDMNGVHFAHFHRENTQNLCQQTFGCTFVMCTQSWHYL